MITFVSVAAARRALTESDPARRAAALSCLASQSYAEKTSDMIAALRDSHETVMLAAVKGLVGQPEDAALAGLLTMLEAASLVLVQAAALALGEHRDHRAVPYLLRVLEHHDWGVRLCSVYALACLGGPQALLALHRALSDHHRDVRFAAASRLSALELRSLAHG